jgi:hypothetical protein
MGEPSLPSLLERLKFVYALLAGEGVASVGSIHFTQMDKYNELD